MGSKFKGKDQILEYKDLIDEAKISKQLCNKYLLHKAGLKDFIFVVQCFALSHQVKGTPFDLPHLIYIYMTKQMKGDGKNKDIIYVALLNKLIWKQGVYFKFLHQWTLERSQVIINRDERREIKQQRFGASNIRAM